MALATRMNGVSTVTETVFENRFPSLSMDAPDVAGSDSLLTRKPGVGRCEVLCYTSDHHAAFSRLSPQRSRR